MSKKTRQKQNQKQQKYRRQMTVILSVAGALLLIAAVVFGIYAKRYSQQNHVDNMEDNEIRSYNYAMTVFGRNYSGVGSNDVLVLDTVDKALGQDTVITFHIYQYTSESDLDDALDMTAQQIAQDGRFEYVGSGTVVLVDDEIAGMSNMVCTYVK